MATKNDPKDFKALKDSYANFLKNKKNPDFLKGINSFVPTVQESTKVNLPKIKATPIKERNMGTYMDFANKIYEEGANRVDTDLKENPIGSSDKLILGFSRQELEVLGKAKHPSVLAGGILEQDYIKQFPEKDWQDHLAGAVGFTLGMSVPPSPIAGAKYVPKGIKALDEARKTFYKYKKGKTIHKYAQENWGMFKENDGTEVPIDLDEEMIKFKKIQARSKYTEMADGGVVGNSNNNIAMTGETPTENELFELLYKGKITREQLEKRLGRPVNPMEQKQIDLRAPNLNDTIPENQKNWKNDARQRAIVSDNSVNNSNSIVSSYAKHGIMNDRLNGMNGNAGMASYGTQFENLNPTLDYQSPTNIASVNNPTINKTGLNYDRSASLSALKGEVGSYTEPIKKGFLGIGDGKPGVLGIGKKGLPTNTKLPEGNPGLAAAGLALSTAGDLVANSDFAGKKKGWAMAGDYASSVGKWGGLGASVGGLPGAAVGAVVGAALGSIKVLGQKRKEKKEFARAKQESESRWRSQMKSLGHQEMALGRYAQDNRQLLHEEDIEANNQIRKNNLSGIREGMRYYNNGGTVKGYATGTNAGGSGVFGGTGSSTSDSIKTSLPPGTAIFNNNPKTPQGQIIGKRFLAELNSIKQYAEGTTGSAGYAKGSVPVAVSPGEIAISPPDLNLLKMKHGSSSVNNWISQANPNATDSVSAYKKGGKVKKRKGYKSGTAPDEFLKQIHNLGYDFPPNMIDILEKNGITDQDEIRMFIAQMAFETDNFTTIKEPFKFTNKNVWDKRKTSLLRSGVTEEEVMAADTEQLMEYMYADKYRYGNYKLGNTEDGDGSLYAGRGYIHITGRENYRKISRNLYPDDPVGQERLVLHPELLETPEIALLASIDYWNKQVDRIAAQNGDVSKVTENVQGSAVSDSSHVDMRTKILSDINEKTGGTTLTLPKNPSSIGPTKTKTTIEKKTKENIFSYYGDNEKNDKLIEKQMKVQKDDLLKKYIPKKPDSLTAEGKIENDAKNAFIDQYQKDQESVNFLTNQINRLDVQIDDPNTSQEYAIKLSQERQRHMADLSNIEKGWTEIYPQGEGLIGQLKEASNPGFYGVHPNTPGKATVFGEDRGHKFRYSPDKVVEDETNPATIEDDTIDSGGMTIVGDEVVGPPKPLWHDKKMKQLWQDKYGGEMHPNRSDLPEGWGEDPEEVKKESVIDGGDWASILQGSIGLTGTMAAENKGSKLLNNFPLDSIPLTLQSDYTNARAYAEEMRQNARLGLTAAEKGLAKSDIEQAYRTTIEQSRNSGSGASIRRLASKDKYRAIIGLTAADAGAKTAKEGVAIQMAARADNLGSQLAKYNRNMYEDVRQKWLTEFDRVTKVELAAGNMFNAGIQNFIQKRSAEEIAKIQGQGQPAYNIYTGQIEEEV